MNPAKLSLDDAAARPRRPALAVGLLWLAPLGFLAIFFFYPLAAILAASFARSSAGPLAPWADLLSRASFPRVIGFTFAQPRGPSSAVKAAATTTVGMTNGTAVSASNRDRPRNVCRPTR